MFLVGISCILGPIVFSIGIVVSCVPQTNDKMRSTDLKEGQLRIYHVTSHFRLQKHSVSTKFGQNPGTMFF